MNVFCAGAGDDIDMEHHESESNQEEIYVVLAGRAGFTIDGVEHEVGVGTIMGAPDPAAVRSIRALEDGTRILCIGAQAGHGRRGLRQPSSVSGSDVPWWVDDDRIEAAP